MVVITQVLNLRPPLEERVSGLMVSAFAWGVLDLDSRPASAGRSCILHEDCNSLSIVSKAAIVSFWFCVWKPLLVFKIL